MAEKKTATSLAVTLTARFGSAASQLILSILLSRSGGLEMTGYFFFLYGLIQLGTTIIKRGYGQAMLANLQGAGATFHTGYHNMRMIGYTLKSFRRTAVIGLVITIIFYASLSMSGFDTQVGLVSLLLLLFFNSELSFLSDLIRSFRRTALSQLVFPTLTIVFVCLAILAGVVVETRDSIVYVLLIAMFLTWLVATALTYRLQLIALKLNSRLGGKLVSAHSVTKESRFLGVSEIATVLSTWMPVVLLQWFGSPVGPNPAGIFALASRLGRPLQIVQSTVNYWIAPRLGGKAGFHDAPKSFQIRAGKAYLVNVVISTPVAALLVVFGKPILFFLFGPDSLNAYPTLVLLVLGYLASVLLGPATLLLSMAGFPQITATCALAGIVVLVICILVLGVTAESVAAAVLVSIVVRNLSAYFMLRIALGFWLLPKSGLKY